MDTKQIYPYHLYVKRCNAMHYKLHNILIHCNTNKSNALKDSNKSNALVLNVLSLPHRCTVDIYIRGLRLRRCIFEAVKEVVHGYIGITNSTGRTKFDVENEK